MYNAGPAGFANHLDGFDPKILEHLERGTLHKASVASKEVRAKECTSVHACATGRVGSGGQSMSGQVRSSSWKNTGLHGIRIKSASVATTSV